MEAALDAMYQACEAATMLHVNANLTAEQP